MGSGKSSLYPSLAQSTSRRANISIPVSTIMYAPVGENVKNARKLKSDCHSQVKIKESKQFGAKFEIERTFKNGVYAGCVKDYIYKTNRKSDGRMRLPKNWAECSTEKTRKFMKEFKKQMQIILAEYNRATMMGENDNDKDEYRKVLAKEIELLSKDLDMTLAYIDGIESADDLELLSEIIDSLLSIFGTRKDELIACFKRNSDRLHADLDDYLEGF